MERNSEMKMVWAVIAIVGAQLLGVDLQSLQHVLEIIAGTEQQLGQLVGRPDGPGLTGNLTLPLLTGLYAFLRTDLKKKRMEADEK